MPTTGGASDKFLCSENLNRAPELFVINDETKIRSEYLMAANELRLMWNMECFVSEARS